MRREDYLTGAQAQVDGFNPGCGHRTSVQARRGSSIFASYRESIIGNPLVAGVAAFFGHVVK
jgi:hypothetical protein